MYDICMYVYMYIYHTCILDTIAYTHHVRREFVHIRGSWEQLDSWWSGSQMAEWGPQQVDVINKELPPDISLLTGMIDAFYGLILDLKLDFPTDWFVLSEWMFFSCVSQVKTKWKQRKTKDNQKFRPAPSQLSRRKPKETRGYQQKDEILSEYVQLVPVCFLLLFLLLSSHH